MQPVLELQSDDVRRSGEFLTNHVDDDAPIIDVTKVQVDWTFTTEGTDYTSMADNCRPFSIFNLYWYDNVQYVYSS